MFTQTLELKAEVLRDDTPLLVEEAVNDISKFSVLYDRYFNDVYRFIFRRVSDPDLSFDLCSVVFLKAMEKLKSYSYRGKPFIAWLYRIALNEVYMQYRKNKIELVYHLDPEKFSSLDEDMDKELKTEQQEKLVDALSKLGKEEIDLVEMRYFSGISITEIAEVLGISENLVSVRIHRVIKKIKELI